MLLLASCLLHETLTTTESVKTRGVQFGFMTYFQMGAVTLMSRTLSIRATVMNVEVPINSPQSGRSVVNSARILCWPA